MYAIVSLPSFTQLPFSLSWLQVVMDALPPCVSDLPADAETPTASITKSELNTPRKLTSVKHTPLVLAFTCISSSEVREFVNSRHKREAPFFRTREQHSWRLLLLYRQVYCCVSLVLQATLLFEVMGSLLRKGSHV